MYIHNERKRNKKHIETGYLFFDSENSNESIYEFFLAQLDKTHKNSNILVYSFNNFLIRIEKQAHLVHTKIADDNFALEDLQVKKNGVILLKEF